MTGGVEPPPPPDEPPQPAMVTAVAKQHDNKREIFNLLLFLSRCLREGI